MILVDYQIRDYVKKGTIKIKNYSLDCVQPASYDMRIGNEVFLSTKRDVIDLKKNGGHFTVEPSAMAMINTHEYLKLPRNILGRPGIKSGLARKGLFSSVGIQADPGFEGCLFINVLNLTPLPVTMDYLDTFLSLEFHELEKRPQKPYEGPYQKKKKITSKDIQPLLAYEGLNLAQIHKGFTELSKNIEVVASLGQKLDRFIESHDKQTEKIMRHNTKLVNEIKRLVEYISTHQKEPTVILKTISREEAVKEIEELFKKEGTLYYSDIADRLRLDLELVVDICNELEAKGIIGMLNQ